jgi:hypothetical protein
VDSEQLEAALNKSFKEKIRIVGENKSRQFSTMWTFVGGNDGFYFGSRSIFNRFKVSLHANNNKGYVAYAKDYFNSKKAEGRLTGFNKAIYEWSLPIPADLGAVHAAVIRLPAEFMREDAHPYISKRKAFVFGIEPQCALEIGIFLSKESRQLSKIS